MGWVISVLHPTTRSHQIHRADIWRLMYITNENFLWLGRERRLMLPVVGLRCASCKVVSSGRSRSRVLFAYHLRLARICLGVRYPPTKKTCLRLTSHRDLFLGQ